MLDSTDTKVRYLLELGTDKISHSGSTLIKHLVGVRKAVRDLIGPAAERLVYEFSILGRPRTHHIGELADGQLREDLTMLNGANQMEMNRRPAKEMELEEAYEGMWNYNGGRRA